MIAKIAPQFSLHSDIFAMIAKIHFAKIANSCKNFSSSFLLAYLAISSIRLQKFTKTAKINTIKIKKNCRKVKNTLEQRLT